MPALVHGQPPDWKRLLLGPQTVGVTREPGGQALIIGRGRGSDIDTGLTSAIRPAHLQRLHLAHHAGPNPSQYAPAKCGRLNPAHPSFHPVAAKGTNQTA